MFGDSRRPFLGRSFVAMLLVSTLSAGCSVVSDSSGDSISIDTSGQSPIFEYALAAYWGDYGNDPGQYIQPYGVAIDPSQKYLLVTDCLRGVVTQSTLDGVFVRQIGDGFGGQPGQLSYDSDIAFDSHGNIWLVEYRNHRVSKFSSEGQYLASFGFQGSGVGQFDAPLGIALDSHDNIYVVDSRNDRVQKFTPDMTFMMTWGESGTGDYKFTSPYYITIDQNDDIYVVDQGEDLIKKYDSEGVFIVSWGGTGSDDGQFDYPHEIAVDQDGYIYVADTNNHRFQVFTANGDFVAKYGNASILAIPKAIAIDDDYNVYIADLGAAVAFITKWSRQTDVAEPVIAASEFLPKISDYNLYLNPPEFSSVSAEAIKYRPEWPLWKNGAIKERFLVLPQGSQIDISNRQKWKFPDGTLFFETFYERNEIFSGGLRAIETRIMMKSGDIWGFAAYIWNDANTDANLLDGITATVVTAVNPFTGTEYDYLIPSESQCNICHGSNISTVIGFVEIQLGLPHTNHPGVQVTHMELFESLGAFNQAIPNQLIDIPEPHRQVYGYFQGNCVHCHNGNRAFDLGYENALANTVNQPATSHFGPGTRVVPGEADNSLLYQLANQGSMPPLGVEIQDPEGIQLIYDWIAGL